MKKFLKKERNRIFDETIGYSILFSSLLVPDKLAVFTIILFFIYKTVFFEKVKNSLSIMEKLFLILVISYFLINAISLIWTDEFESGLKEIESISSFLLLPPLMVLFRRGRPNYDRLAYFFSKGLNVLLVVCIGIALYNSLKYIGFQYWPFKYYNFTYWVDFHPGYLSLLLLISIINLVFLYRKDRKKSTLISFVFQTAMLFFIGAKYSLLAFIVSMIFLLILFRSEIKRGILWVAVGVICLSAVSLSLSLNTFDRLANIEDAFKKRIELNEAAFLLATKRIWFGYGSGGVDKRLMDQYRTDYNIEAFENRYNAHNQYLQTLLTTGLFGLLILLAILITAIKVCKNKNLCFLIVLQFMFFFMIESALERQKGVLTFVIWMMFIVFYANEETN